LSTRWFLALYLLCLGVMLGFRFALEPLARAAGVAVAPEAEVADAVMAVPPKPAGVEELPQEAGVAGAGGTALLSRAYCDGAEEALRDLCYHQLARQGAARDPRGSLPICDLVRAEETRLECLADVAELSAEVDRAGAEAICATIGSVKWRGQCHFGIGLALAEIDPEYALRRCESAEIFRDFCRHDVVGEVALQTLEPAVAFCAREEGDALTRKTCWHGIGKYLARRDFREAVAACERSTESWRGNCYHGVGWGAAERDPDATLAACDALPAWRDNCRQGVGHQQKRADPTRAIAICESIGAEAIRSRCLAFVKR
jgi:hypothetical protein